MMNEADEQIIKLLEEVRGNQVKWNKAASEYTEYIKKMYDTYDAQLSQHRDSQKARMEQYEQSMHRRTVLITILLGIVALCMVIGVALRIVGR